MSLTGALCARSALMHGACSSSKANSIASHNIEDTLLRPEQRHVIEQLIEPLLVVRARRSAPLPRCRTPAV